MCKKISFSLIFAVNILSANSPSALSSLTQEHRWVVPVHKDQNISLSIQLNILKKMLLEKSETIFEIGRFNRLQYNYFIIKNEKTGE